MRMKDLALLLEPPDGSSLCQRVTRTIIKAIASGRLRPGTALPGSRVLAEELSAGRSTVIAALETLEAEGWVVSEPGRGTFVAARPPLENHVRVSVPAVPSPLGFDLPSHLHPITTAVVGAMNLSVGLTDSRLAPSEDLAKAYQRAMRLHGDALLGAGEPQGNSLLRETLAQWVSERYGCPVEAERILITRGGRMALAMVALALLRPGDAVAVENPGHSGAWETLAQTRKASLIPLAVDEEGVVLESLEAALNQAPVKMLYLTPRRQYPTGVTLAPARAEGLLALAAKHRVAIFEDDTDGEIHFGEERPFPLLARDGTGQVIFSASFSQFLAPGLQLGFLVVPAGLVAPLTRVRRDLGSQGDRVLEWAMGDLIRDGLLAGHLRRVRKIYKARRDHLVALLRQELGGHLTVQVPTGGLALWVQARGFDPRAWLEAARGCDLILNPPAHYFLDHATPSFRMGFSQWEESQLEEAVLRLKRAL